MYNGYCRKLEKRKERLEMDTKRIREKEEKFEELTPGQIAGLLSNERSLEQLTEELEELEDAIHTSILEKIHPTAARVSLFCHASILRRKV